MNCDQAFDEMTRADGRQSPELMQHFERCPRCREMAQVLAPVLTGLQMEGETLAQHAEGVPVPSRHETPRLTALAPDRDGPAPVFLTRVHQRSALWLKVASVCIAGIGTIIGAMLLSARSAPEPLIPSSSAHPHYTIRDCNWVNPELVSSGFDGRNVTLTCVACHLPGRN